MVRVNSLSKIATMAVMLLSNRSIVLALTSQEVTDKLIDSNNRAAAVNATAQRINPSWSCIEYGKFNAGPLKDIVQRLPALTDILDDLTASLEPAVTPPLVLQPERTMVYEQFYNLLTVSRQFFAAVSKNSEDVDCTFDILGIVLDDFSEEGARMYNVLVDSSESISNLGPVMTDYLNNTALYYNDIIDRTRWVRDLANDAIERYEGFQPSPDK